jgi:hypothetical protein
MKNIILSFFVTLIFIESSAAYANDEEMRGYYYQSLSVTSPGIAIEVFLTDEILSARCGVAPSLNYLKEVATSKNFFFVQVALRKGNINDAKSRIASLPCEKNAK